MQPAARLLVSLFVCPYAIVLVFICLNSQRCFERVTPNFKISTHWKTTFEKTSSERTFANISNMYFKWYSLATSMECAWRMNPCLVSVEPMEHLLDHGKKKKRKDISKLLCRVLSKEIIASVFCRSVISKTTITSSIVGPSKGQPCPAVVATASSPWSPR